MTLEELAALPKETLTCAEIAPIIGIYHDTIRGQARHCQERLGFPVVVAGRQVRIPKRAFLAYMQGGNE